MPDHPIQLGDIVRDPISGFTGKATGLHTYLHGCRHISVTPQKLQEDGSPGKYHTFDEPQLEIVERPEPPKMSPRRDVGGPSLQPHTRQMGEG